MNQDLKPEEIEILLRKHKGGAIMKDSILNDVTKANQEEIERHMSNIASNLPQ